MNNKDKVYTGLSQDESDRMQRYLKEISKIYGIRLAELGDFLGKRLKDHLKGEHQWFMAFMIIDEIFERMEKKFLDLCTDDSRRKLIKSIIRETQTLIKEELPLPRVDEKNPGPIWDDGKIH